MVSVMYAGRGPSVACKCGKSLGLSYCVVHVSEHGEDASESCVGAALVGVCASSADDASVIGGMSDVVVGSAV